MDSASLPDRGGLARLDALLPWAQAARIAAPKS